MSEGQVLLYGYGNPGRLDDGLGPALVARFEKLALPGVTLDADYQLMIEDAAEAAAHEVVIFADAAVEGREPFYFHPLQPVAEGSFTSHSVSPEALLALAESCFGADNMVGYVLGIRGYEFNEFGERLSEKALANLDAAVDFLCRTIESGDFAAAVTDDKKSQVGS